MMKHVERTKEIIASLSENKAPNEKYQDAIEALYLATELGIEAIDAGQIYDQAVLYNMEEGMTQQKALALARTKPEYMLKKQYELYRDVAFLLHNFLKDNLNGS